MAGSSACLDHAGIRINEASQTRHEDFDLKS